METTQDHDAGDPGSARGNAVPGSGGTDRRDDVDPGGRRCRRGRGRCIAFALVLALLAGLAGGFIGKSIGRGPALARLADDPAQRDAQVERFVRRAASRLDATPEQQQKLAAIARGAAADLVPLRDKMRAAGREALALASAPTVDRAGVERLRVEQLALADAVTRRLTLALADAAEVLTPDQRKAFVERVAERMARRGHDRAFGRG